MAGRKNFKHRKNARRAVAIQNMERSKKLLESYLPSKRRTETEEQKEWYKDRLRKLETAIRNTVANMENR